MNIGLLGYGKMGKEIEAVAKQRSHSISTIADVGSHLPDMKLDFEKCNVFIDFSVAAAVVEHAEFAAELKKPIVIGTTGWQKDLERVKKIINGCGITAVAGSNFSLGVNLFISTVEKAAKLFGQFDDFDCAVLESHHNQKADAPSGTAITIGNAILANFPAKKKIRPGLPEGRIAKEELQINSIRIGSDFGTHSVFFDSENDRIELTHISRGRRGLAFGAVLAAEWAIGKDLSHNAPMREGFHQFRDIISELKISRAEN
jgi:4-hydroxy-tetrahydrodipicolinate reductase